MNQTLIGELRVGLASGADPARAVGQQAYMKSAIPYYGLTMPETRSLCRELFKTHTIPSADVWQETILALWREAGYREERYAALELLGYKPYRRFFNPSLLTTLDELIVSGAWWDYVDNIAINFVGHLLARHPTEVTPVLLRWSEDHNIWRRRSAILAQLKFKDRTDLALLIAFIEPSLEDSLIEKEFFLRKAIGWALRQYSRTDPEAVIGYVATNRDRLSGLSRREGLKVLIKQGLVAKSDPRFGLVQAAPV